MANFLLRLANDSAENPMRVYGKESRWHSEAQELITRLRSTFRDIPTLVEFAELRQLKDEGAKKWLTDVKDVCYDLIDVFDEWGILQAKLHKQNKSRLSSFPFSFLNPSREHMVCDYSSKKIPELIANMDEVMKYQIALGLIKGTSLGISDEHMEDDEEDHLLLKEKLQEERREIPPEEVTSSSLAEEKIFGRKREKELLISLLLVGSRLKESVNFVSVVGIGGIGKTTVAQLVYDNEKVKNRFVLRAWVCVSEEFNPIRIIKEIVESVTGESYPMNQVESEALIQRFRRMIAGKRYLFVLDDVWSEDSSKWEQLKHFCESHTPGNVILITTRNHNVAHVGRPSIMHLDKLDAPNSWAMFRNLAFDSDQTKLKHPLEELGRHIVNRCQGVPLAVKTVGRLLHGASVEEWEAARKWQLLKFQISRDKYLEKYLEFQESSLMSTFMLSYSQLRPYLRQCLLYCSIFPKNHSINVDKLIQLWLAQSYITSKNDEMEKEGQNSLAVLLRYSLFENLRRDDKGNLLCNMAGGLADFIKLLTENECFIMHIDENTEDDVDLSLQKCRHWTLSVAPQASLPVFVRIPEKTHTLIIMSEHSFVDPTALSNLLSHSKRLRALDLSHCFIRGLPSNIGKLLHLRYLDLSFIYDLTELPEILCDLSLLQTVNLNGCDNLQKLPNGIERLTFLRHLEILWTKSLSYLPKGIACLTSLRTLNRFFGTGDAGSKACNLGDLGKLNHLQGFISIDGLGGVTDVALAEKAGLKEKEELLGVDLWFSGVGSEVKDSIVLEALQPPPNLKSLGITYYRGISFPQWMAEMKQLRHLMLSDCSECEVLPPLGKLPCLESLEIRNLIHLKRVDVGFLGIESDGEQVFPGLKKLHFHNLKNWLEWDEITDSGANITIMPKLSSLSIVKCSKIRAFPDYIKGKLETLSCHIAECPLLSEEKPAEN